MKVIALVPVREFGGVDEKYQVTSLHWQCLHGVEHVNPLSYIGSLTYVTNLLLTGVTEVCPLCCERILQHGQQEPFDVC